MHFVTGNVLESSSGLLDAEQSSYNDATARVPISQPVWPGGDMKTIGIASTIQSQIGNLCFDTKHTCIFTVIIRVRERQLTSAYYCGKRVTHITVNAFITVFTVFYYSILPSLLDKTLDHERFHISVV